MTLVANGKNLQPEKSAANLPPISLTPVVYLREAKKIDDPTVIFRGLGEDDSHWKKSEAKNLVTLSL